MLCPGETMRPVHWNPITVIRSAGSRCPLQALAAFVVVGGLCACATNPPSQPVANRAAEAQPYKFESEGSVPPLRESDVRAETDKVDTFEHLVLDEDTVSVLALELEETTPTSAVVDSTSRTMAGYRVQIFASGELPRARSVRASAESELGFPVYVNLEDGIYKVSVGDCPTREEAEGLLQKCRDAGYADSWIVSTTVNLPQRSMNSPSDKSRP